ncbi:MAG: hypothetical protein COU35_01945 [Candidatus Magasanikbacteria bacterium CG10_big_fil_rev_8_21_14_0_10_47_10]|uniref:3D domain-containing protein n=1 Tax=Candidatus Magasanikbacteria bacterium CG10_big_fil_rev_8_21_14_0_10_47_10 TaxID=1974652 RepID=A0A2H0TSW5_9BACT|nr:MAG: hypothetical protein COU35_01945 [Candidatus Magasanikbacteria bacterium CG10_big_fil_rev_8_21_14_0_10_47_10]
MPTQKKTKTTKRTPVKARQKASVKKTVGKRCPVSTRKRTPGGVLQVRTRWVDYFFAPLGGMLGVAAIFVLISIFAIRIEPLPPDVVVDTVMVVATAYSSTPDQTDATPCITADGFDLCEHGQETVIAANFLSFGTRVRFPELGNNVYTVHDRMNSRYGNGRVDIWLKTRDDARIFGAKTLTMEILD